MSSFGSMPVAMLRHNHLYRCAVLALIFGSAEASIVDVLTKVKTFRSAGLELFSGLAEELKSRKEDSASKKAEAFSNDWLSLLGVQKGLTGLAKDFTLNYLGRESYHDRNGPLVDALKQVSATLSARLGEEELGHELLRAMKKVCFEGKRLFASGGSLHEMLSDLLELLESKGAREALPHVMSTSRELKEALSYFSGPRVANEEL
eukprot:s2716_g8.t1